MVRIIGGLVVLSLVVALVLVGPARAAGECVVKPPRFIYFPIMGRQAEMGRSPLEEIEKLVRQPADFPFDGWVLEIFPETVTVKLVGSDQVKRNVLIPDHIPAANIKKGMPVKLTQRQGTAILVAILPQLQGDLNYAGKGSVIPRPPLISVVGIQDGWLISWPAVAGADRYRVYRNDDPDETSPDEVGVTSNLSLIVPYEDPFIYFAVKAVSGLNESQVSGWLTDNTPPPVPTTFVALNDVAGHRLTISGSDQAMTHQGFKCFEIEQANDGSGTGAASLGLFFLSDFPNLRPFGVATVKYYRIRSVDWAGNASAWTAWDYAYAGQQEIEDKFDGYGGSVSSPLGSLWWLKIADFDPDEAWSNSYTLYVVDGQTTMLIPGGITPPAYTSSTFSIDRSFDLTQEGRFASGDFVILTAYTDAVSGTLSILFSEADGASSSKVFSLAQGWNFLKAKRSEFTTASGSPSWNDVTGVKLTFTPNADAKLVAVDDLRIVRVDPDNSTTYNDTGRAWDKAANTGTDFGEWHVYEGNRTGEPGKPFSYGQIKTATSPAVWYLSHKPLETTQITTGTVQAGVYLKGADGQAGLAFFVKDVTAGSWDTYAVEADTSANQIRLVRWVAGTRTAISTVSFTSSPDTLLWLGVDLRDYDADGGRIKVFASYGEGNLIQAANMIISAQDTNVGSGGSVGVLSYQANVRFVNFVAGSPEHAAVADVARALDGPIVAGDAKRVRYNTDLNRFEYSSDGSTWTPITSPAIGARVYNNAAITLTTATWTALTFNSEEYDYGDLHSTSSNTGRLTAPVAGLYHISLLVTFTNNTNGQRGLRIRHQGSTDIAVEMDDGVGGSNYTHMALSTLFKLAAGEYVTAEAYQSSGGNLNILAIANYSPNFAMQLNAPL